MGAEADDQCSRLKPLCEFCFEGLSNFSVSIEGEGLVQIQNANPRTYYKWNIKLILYLCMDYVVCVSSTTWRVKNQPSNPNSCSDNALRLLVLVVGRLYWGLQVMSSFSIRGCVLKGGFKRGIFWRAKSRLKGTVDFNLEHYRWSSASGRLVDTLGWGKAVACLYLIGSSLWVLALVENMVKRTAVVCPLRFWPPWFAVTKQLQIILSCFTPAILKFWGHETHRWKGIFKTFPAAY